MLMRELKPIEPGTRFGKLTTISVADKSHDGRIRYLFKCDCGKKTVVLKQNITKSVGPTTSCGCFGRERFTSRTHGKSGTREFKVWAAMMSRAHHRSGWLQPRYLARGIKVCKRWQKFENFHADMGDVPEGLSLDRIDNDGDYSPENCRWATRRQQALNQSRNRRIKFNGRRLTISEWAIELGIDRRTLDHRLNYGWSVRRALTEPVGYGVGNNQTRRITAEGS